MRFFSGAVLTMMIGNAAGNDCAKCKILIPSFHRLNLYSNVTVLNVYSSGLTVLNMMLFMDCKSNSYSSLKYIAMVPETLVKG